ncbi:UDP-N-acetylglucosamine transferase subunit alg14 [Penicillium citrinum]|uniref:UDP-N-acetylglucosamine transferase subunit ALG14 n=1 Tax=Penicillium citrinum TaxID=5077 RepID=A0A9W9ND17_PENCI|nr:UDP-N-acetylglucosamine transferase subunit alg14 [Penicillium citrinum]KAJ5217621.1 UDP-N-acetylglucosamine transferase subunit alg14 [Penicillium citrinum]
MASLLEIVWEPFWKILVPVAVLGFLAVLVLLASLFISQNIKFPKIPRHRTPIHILIVLGSGGHTTEMLYMLNKTAFDPSVWAYRTYVTTSGDNFSANKAAEFEARLSGRLNDIIDKPDLPNDISELFEGTNVQAKNKQEFENSKNVTKVDYPTSGDSFRIIEVPRARKVHQSYLTAPFSTIHCLWACLLVLLGRFPGQKPVPSSYESPCPDVILTNGPAVAVCMMLAAKIIRFFSFTTRWLMGRGSTPNVARLRTIYIESWARVRNLSVSGKLLLPVADSFIVQWRTLEGRQAWPGMKKTQYKGWLVI